MTASVTPLLVPGLVSLGADLPVWALALVGLAVLGGLVLIVLGSRRKKDDEQH